MAERTLTQKQAYFLNQLQEIEQSGLTIAQLAERENVSTALLYNYRHVLRQKGCLEPAQKNTAGSAKSRSAFAPVRLSTPQDSEPTKLIELKTQLANGQPIWMSVPAGQLQTVLAVLSA